MNKFIFITLGFCVYLPTNIYIEMENEEKKLSFELKQDIAKVDFATMLPGLPKPEVTNRIIMSPEHAKRLLLALQDNISKYEAQNGQITFGEPKGTFPMGGFGNMGNGAKS